MTRPSVSFIIPVRDDATRLARCLKSIHAATPPGGWIEIIVADNGSLDESPVVAHAAGATVLDLPHLRVGEMRNRAAAVSASDILGFVDADHEIGAEWTACAVEAFRHADTGAIGAPCHAPSPGTWVQRSYDRLRRHPKSREPVAWLGSGNMAVRRSDFEAIGGFDTSLETCEDVDLCRKIRARGRALFADRRMRNVHYGDPSTLGQVFYGELWRGRDNLRVSLRSPVTGRTLLSAAMPVANLLAIVAAIAGAFMGGSAGWILATGAVGYLVLGVMLRAFAMARQTSISEWGAACAVAAAYEAGRALAVAGRFGYGRRRHTAER